VLEDFRKLVELTRDNPLQQLRLVDIETKVKAKFAELDETIKLARAGKIKQALQIVKSNLGRQIMASLRAEFVGFQTEEERLLDLRQKEFKSGQDFMRLLLFVETAFLVLFLLAVAFVIQKSMVTPIVRLTKNTHRFAKGEDIQDLPHTGFGGEDEMGQLVDAFNDMVHRIKASIHGLDISQREIEAKEQRLSEIIWSTNVGTWEWNIDTDELAVNDRWANITGRTLDEMMPFNADSWREICHPGDLERSQAALTAHYSGETDSYKCEIRRRHKNGSWVWVLDRGKIVEWHTDGRPLRMSGTNSDISQQKENEKIKSEFISTVSHELRTPLTSIKGSLGLIRSGTTGELPEKLRSMLEIAYRNSERLVLLINDILDIEKIEAGKMDFQMKPVEVNSLIEEAIEANKGYAEEHNVSFVAKGLLDQALIMGDRDRLMQVMSNLMSNAAKFSSDGAKVDISVTRDRGDVQISVQDQGPGIPENFRASIFDKFSQADSSDTRRVGGTGLGLSITKAILETHKGSLDFVSETNANIGTGTTFFVTFPELADQSVPYTQQEDKSSQRILICEDEADVANILQVILQEVGFNTEIANTAARAKELLAENDFAAMTLDLGLPDQDGISLMLELRNNSKTCDLPVIVVSARAEEGKQELNSSAIGVVDWIQKPIDPANLVERLSRSLRPLEDTRPRILHVEDDESVVEIVTTLIEEMGQVLIAKSLQEARALLRSHDFDLVLLDLMLPDGSGESLLPLLHRSDGKSIPVVVFSAREISPDLVKNIKTVLIKSRTTNEDLLSVIRAAIKSQGISV
jgi:PAS domain S-box-containing protein